MGYLYNEIIENDYKKRFRYVFAGLILLLVLDAAAIVVLTSKKFAAEILLLGLVVFAVVAVQSYFIWLKANRRYRYSIIDNELIIERLNGCKRKVMLNINLKAIEKIERIDNRLRSDSMFERWKKFSYMDSKESGYLCRYKINEKEAGFCFEPSPKLIEKIHNLIGEKIVA